MNIKDRTEVILEGNIIGFEYEGISSNVILVNDDQLGLATCGYQTMIPKMHETVLKAIESNETVRIKCLIQFINRPLKDGKEYYRKTILMVNNINKVEEN